MQKTWSQYRLTKELTKKYSHSTYLASPTNPQRGHGEPEHHVVVTMFTLSLLGGQDEHKTMLLKAECIRELKHDHLTPILDIRVEEEQLFVVREYLPGESLRHRLKRLFPQGLELQEALTLVSQVGQALQYAHEHHIIHGNIKPENILFDANGQASLADFSLVDVNDVVRRDQIAEEYAFCYLAPEQFIGRGDARSDQYALGCLAYELITGHLPFATQSFTSMIGQHTNTQPVPLSSRVADLSPSLEAAVLKAMAKDPSDRHHDISVFLEAMGTDVLPSAPVFPFHPYAKTLSGPPWPWKMQQSDTHFLTKLEPIPAPENHPVKQSQDSLLIKDEIDDGPLSDPIGEHESLILPAMVPKTSLHPAWFAAEETTVSLAKAANTDELPIAQPPYTRRRLLSPLQWVLALSVISAFIFYAFWSSSLSLPGNSSHIILKMGMGTRRGTPQAISPSLTQLTIQVTATLLPTPPPSALPSPTGTSASQSTNPIGPLVQTPSASNSVVQTITFDDLPQTDHPLQGQYPKGVIDWGQNTWEVMPPSAYHYSSNVIQFANQGMQEASFTFLQPQRLLQFDAYNGGGSTTATVLLSCAGLPDVSASIAPGKVVTVKTGWDTACSNPMLHSSNGWDMLFDNLLIASL